MKAVMIKKKTMQESRTTPIKHIHVNIQKKKNREVIT